MNIIEANLNLPNVFIFRRSKHTLVAWGDLLYVFGGDNGYGYSNVFYLL